jgi:hypothetical protein
MTQNTIRQPDRRRIGFLSALVEFPARQSIPALGAEWGSSHQQRDMATAKKSPTLRLPTVGSSANWTDARGSVPDGQVVDAPAAIGTASSYGTHTSVRQSSNRGRIASLQTVFIG